MLKIRLKRNGAKKRPFYQIVVTDNRNSRNGRFIEKLGFFNPILVDEKKSIMLNIERINYWIEKGSILSNRVKSLMKKNKKNIKNDFKNFSQKTN